MNRVHHLHIKGITYLFFLLLALSAQSLMSEGFAAGTAVHTPAGFRAIEEIEPGHEVLSFDRVKRVLAKNIVMQRHCHRVDACVQVHLGDQVIEVDEKQCFLDADLHEWCEAKKLASGQRIVTHNRVAKTITFIQRKKLAQARVLYALSLCHGPRNFCVTKDKIVAHNIAPLVVLAGVGAIVNGARIVTQLYAAYQGRNTPKVDNPFQNMFDEMVAAHSMRSVTFGNLVESPVAKNFPQEVLQEYIHKFGATTPLGNLSRSDLSVFAQRVGIEPHLVELMTDPVVIARAESPIVPEESAQSTSETKTGEETSTNNVTQPTSSWGELVTGVTRNSLKNGAVNGGIQLGIGLLTGDIESIGQAVLTMTKAVGGTVAKDAVLTTGKTAAVAVGNKLAPELTKKALEYVPVVGTVITVANTAWSVYKLGKGIKDLIRARKKPHLQGTKLQLPAPKESSSNGGSNNNNNGSKGPPDQKEPRNTDFFGNMYEVFKKTTMGKILKEASEGTSFFYQGAKIFKVIKDLPQYGIKKGDYFYLDMLHKDHIEVFKSCKKVMRTVLNMDGKHNLKKLADALEQGRRIIQCFS